MTMIIRVKLVIESKIEVEKESNVISRNNLTAADPPPVRLMLSPGSFIAVVWASKPITHFAVKLVFPRRVPRLTCA